jgi:hypothetical protein
MLDDKLGHFGHHTASLPNYDLPKAAGPFSFESESDMGRLSTKEFCMKNAWRALKDNHEAFARSEGVGAAVNILIGTYVIICCYMIHTTTLVGEAGIY